MVETTAPVALPSARRGDEGKSASLAAALPVAQSLVDLCLAERVEWAVRATGYPPLRAVEAFVCGPLVILRGRVPSYYIKQLAQAAALDVAGVRELRDDVEVVRF